MKSKNFYITNIHRILGTHHYQVLWSDYGSQEYSKEYESKDEAVKDGARLSKLTCLIEFYKSQDSDVRTDHMHGKTEIECLRKLYHLLNDKPKTMSNNKRPEFLPEKQYKFGFHNVTVDMENKIITLKSRLDDSVFTITDEEVQYIGSAYQAVMFSWECLVVNKGFSTKDALLIVLYDGGYIYFTKEDINN